MEPDHRRPFGFSDRICHLHQTGFLGKSHPHRGRHHDGGAQLQKTAARNTAGFQMLLDCGLRRSSLVGHAAFLSLGSFRLADGFVVREPESWLAAASESWGGDLRHTVQRLLTESLFTSHHYSAPVAQRDVNEHLYRCNWHTKAVMRITSLSDSLPTASRLPPE